MTAPALSRPLLCPWYRLVPSEGRLLLEYAQSVVVLEGAAVGRFLPRLLPLLDGTRTVDELVLRLGAAARPAVELALETLDRYALLVEGPGVPPDLRDTSHAVAAAYRLAPTMVAERLSSAVIGVVGESPAGVEVARMLQLARIGEVRRLAWSGLSDVDLAVVAPAQDELVRLALWNASALSRGTRWLGIRPFDGRFAAVGPLIVPGESCCDECVRLRRASNLEYGPDLRDIEATPTAAVADYPTACITAAVAAQLALRWIVAHDTRLPGVLYAVEPLAITEHVVLRVPRCPACSIVDTVAPPLPWHAAEAA